MNIFGIGTDIVEISRIEDSIERFGAKFLDRVFTEAEQSYCEKMGRPATHFAGRFAAKEAVVKAMGTGIGEHANWTDLEVINGTMGKPVVRLTGPAEEYARENSITEIHLSLSHAHHYATAQAVAVTEK